MGKRIGENKSLLILLILFFIVPFFFLGKFYEFFALVIPMYVNEYGGIIVWLAFGKPIWQIGIASASASNVATILLYFGLDLGRIIFDKIKSLILKDKKIKQIAADSPKREIKFYQKAMNWVFKKGIFFAYFLCAIPFIPFVGIALVVYFQVRGQKSGILILCGLGFIRAFLTVLAIHHGFYP